MRLKEGRCYRTRDGRLAGPIKVNPAPAPNGYIWMGQVEESLLPATWTVDGNFLASGGQHQLDLIKAADVGAAREKTIAEMTLADYRHCIEKFYAPVRKAS
jgi:hypothetical protein